MTITTTTATTTTTILLLLLYYYYYYTTTTTTTSMTTQSLLLLSHWYDRLLFNSPNRPGSKQRGRVIFCAACKSPTDWLRVSASCQGQSARAAAGRHVREVSCAALAVR